jgi:hypothetical protein
MNNMERLLADDLGDLLDRLATGIPEGTGDDIWRRTPRLRARLDQVEAHLAAEYAALTEAYGSWKRALEDLENIWALAAWRSTADDAPEDLPRIAA